MQFLETMMDYVGTIIIGAISLLTIIVFIRFVVAHKKGKKIDITPVGVFEDLPSSVTGMNKEKIEDQINS